MVDDDRLVLSSLVLGLQDAGFRTFAAETVAEAEELLASGIQPRLAILDMRLREGSGLQIAERLKELDHVPFMFLSAYRDDELVETATRLGALGYLVKPIDVAQLVPAVRAALARADEIRELRDNRRNLQQALDGDREISIAIGIAMVQHKLGRAEAFELLRRSARNQRRKLAELAKEVVAAQQALNLDGTGRRATANTNGQRPPPLK
ncbi:MAG: response regulator [Rhodocyclaceae bacterium]|nr:response regulator [Rhodocyclaceae bacterium]